MRNLKGFVAIGAAVMAISPSFPVNASPQIANVHPDHFGRHLRTEFNLHHMLIGEGFAEEGMQIHAAKVTGDPEAAMREPGFDPLAPLPAEPIAGSKVISPIDVENQVAVAPLADANLVWVETREGLSTPYLMNVAKPFWLSTETASPGERMYMFGFGIRGHLVLRNNEGIHFASLIQEARSPRHADQNLVYFEVPGEIPTGSYEVFAHNGNGGKYGWRSAGTLQVEAKVEKKSVRVNVRDHGATGLGFESDLAALRKAIAEVSKAGGGEVYLPPGTYLIEETLRVPEGVRLMGAGGDQSILRGGLFDPEKAMRGWWAPTEVAASVLVLESNTRLENIGVTGAVSRGEGGYGIISGAATEGARTKNITIKGCRIDAAEEDTETAGHRYRAALVFAGTSNHISIMDSDITGSLEMRPSTRRSEVINNTFRRGTVLDVSSIMISGQENVIDANRFVDTPGRLVLYRSSRSLVRYNEIHNHGRGGWTNVPEPFLLHGGASAGVGSPTSTTPTTLTDARQSWQPGEHIHATVLISAGRGMGQYRLVKGNTADTLELEKPWRVEPDETSEYSVGSRFTENILFANQNHTPGRTSLWLDCIANIVHMHRDAYAGGIDIWGQDRSSVKDGKASLPQRFHPSWFNIVSDSWLDGSALSMTGGVSETNAWRGIPLFGNYFMLNRVSSPHMERNPNVLVKTPRAGIQIPGGKGRTGSAYSMVIGNFIANTPTGVRVAEGADKTFIIGNRFVEVSFPIVNKGTATTILKNLSEAATSEGTTTSPVEDISGQEAAPVFTPPSMSTPFVQSHPPGTVEVELLKSRLAWRSYPAGHISPEESKTRTLSNLESLHKRITDYADKNGTYPDAAFYPVGNDDGIGIDSLLGENASELLTTPANGILESVHYIWNPDLSGKKPGEIKNPAGVWMLADMLASHSWLVENQFAGYEGTVPILFADGSIQWLSGKEAASMIQPPSAK